MKPMFPSLLLAALTLGSPATLWPQEPKAEKDLHGDPLPPGTLARMGTTRLRPGDRPTHLLFTADSKQLICSAGGYGTANALVYYDVANGKELKRVNLLDSRVLAATMTADGRGLAIVLLVPGEQNYYLWEFTDPKAVFPRPKGPLQPRTSYDSRSLTISPDGRWVASAGRNSGEAERPVEIHAWASGRVGPTRSAASCCSRTIAANCSPGAAKSRRKRRRSSSST